MKIKSRTRFCILSLAIGMIVGCAEVAPEVRFEESRSKGCAAANLALGVANEGFSDMRSMLEEDDFAGFYETGDLVANLGAPLERAAEPEDTEFGSNLRELALALAEFGGSEIATDFLPMRTGSAVNDYFAMKTHHTRYMEDAIRNVVTEGTDLLQFCP